MSDHRPRAPRDPCEFSETDHFSDAFESEMRFIERDMVDQIIIRGRDYPDEGGPNKFRRKLEYNGVDAVLVIALDDPVLVTAWTEIKDMQKAMMSGEWSYDQLETIDAFEQKLHKNNSYIDLR